MIAGRLVTDQVTVDAVFGRADLILIGHAHYEHLMDVPAIAKKTGAHVAGSPTACRLLVHMGLPSDRCTVMRGGQRATLAGVDVTALDSRHAKLALLGSVHPGKVQRQPRFSTLSAWDAPAGQPLLWIVRLGGHTIVHNSSAGLPADPTVMSRAAPDGADLVFAAIALREQTPGYARTLIAYLSPKVIVPHHWDDFFEPLTPKLDPELIEDAERFAAEARGALVTVPAPFEVLRWTAAELDALPRGQVAGAAATR